MTVVPAGIRSRCESRDLSSGFSHPAHSRATGGRRWSSLASQDTSSKGSAPAGGRYVVAGLRNPCDTVMRVRACVCRASPPPAGPWHQGTLHWQPQLPRPATPAGLPSRQLAFQLTREEREVGLGGRTPSIALQRAVDLGVQRVQQASPQLGGGEVSRGPHHHRQLQPSSMTQQPSPKAGVLGQVLSRPAPALLAAARQQRLPVGVCRGDARGAASAWRADSLP